MTLRLAPLGVLRAEVVGKGGKDAGKCNKRPTGGWIQTSRDPVPGSGPAASKAAFLGVGAVRQPQPQPHNVPAVSSSCDHQL